MNEPAGNEPERNEPERTVLTSTDARQAVRGHGARYVLYISVAAAIAAMIVAWLVA